MAERARSERDAGTSNDRHRDKERRRESRREYADSRGVDYGTLPFSQDQSYSSCFTVTQCNAD